MKFFKMLEQLEEIKKKSFFCIYQKVQKLFLESDIATFIVAYMKNRDSHDAIGYIYINEEWVPEKLTSADDIWFFANSMTDDTRILTLQKKEETKCKQ